MAKKRTDSERRERQCERMARLLRVLRLIMEAERWNADALAVELKCSRRTVHRDLQTLSMAGVPWYFDQSCRAYRVRQGYTFANFEPATVSKLETDKLGPAVEKLIVDGDAFLKSLHDFLSVLKSSVTHPNH